MINKMRLCVSVLTLAAVTAIGVVTVAAVTPEQSNYPACDCRTPSGRLGHAVYVTELGREQCSLECAIDTESGIDSGAQ